MNRFVICIQTGDGCYIYTITYNVKNTVNRIWQRIFIAYLLLLEGIELKKQCHGCVSMILVEYEELVR